MPARHHSTRKGKKVSVKLITGEVVVGKFTEVNNRYCIIDWQRIPWERVRSFKILKGGEK